MRTWLTGCLTVLAVAGWMAPGSAESQAPKTITITQDGFSPAKLTLRYSGETISWVSESGVHTIVSGTPEDPVENQGKLFEIAVTPDKPVDKPVSLDPNTPPGQYPIQIPFFLKDLPTVRGVLTVDEATPIKPATWGYLKRLFEN